jgi:signal transduction histidine kinase
MFDRRLNRGVCHFCPVINFRVTLMESLSYDNRSLSGNRLPWWTWLASLLIFHAGTEISLLFKYDQGVADYYLPTALSIILVNWWGPWRVIPIVYLNAVLSTPLWDIPVDRWYQWFIYAIPETILCFLSWYLFSYLAKGKFWFPDLRNTLLFLFLGIVIPIVVEILFLQTLLTSFGDQKLETFWTYSVRNWLGEFTSCFGLVLPALFYLSPIMNKKGLILHSIEKLETKKIGKRQWSELLLMAVVLIALVFTIEFEQFWYIYGFFSLYAAIRFGFGAAVLTNYYIFLMIYVLPKFLKHLGYGSFYDFTSVINILLGASLLFVFAAITGRILSDVKIAELKLQQQNAELDKTNQELDRFVYSVSHDLSAPLKSILGLVNVSRITKEPSEHFSYLSRIEFSVKKLEVFIAEILDYSKNKRQHVVAEQVKLQELCHEILENLKYMEEFKTIQVDLSAIEQKEVIQDRLRLKMILNNLLTNAVKFQKRIPGHAPYIKVSSRRKGEKVFIEIEDNGEGIRDELQPKIFDMFFRATDSSRGSGLGLYIAKEAAQRIHGDISVKSVYGEGSTFTVELRNLNRNLINR